MNKECFEKMKEELDNNLLKDWLIFREEELCTLTPEDRKYLLHFDEYFENILKKVSTEDYNYVKQQLDNIYDSFMDYSSHWNDKYYMTGFGDAVKLIISTLK